MQALQSTKRLHVLDRVLLAQRPSLSPLDCAINVLLVLHRLLGLHDADADLRRANDDDDPIGPLCVERVSDARGDRHLQNILLLKLAPIRGCPHRHRLAMHLDLFLLCLVADFYMLTQKTL